MIPVAEAADPIALRVEVIRARAAEQRGDLTRDQLCEVVDRYLDACALKFKARWPAKKFRRPSRAYILRAL